MNPVTRATPAGRAYLDLQNRARREGRGTQEYLTAYVVERWLARLSGSPHASQFVLKGGVLLAALGQRRPTVDADALAIGLAADADVVATRVAEIAAIEDPEDGVEYVIATLATQTIRDHALYHGIRVAMDARIATAVVKLRLDINFGDPVTPEPRLITLPGLRPDSAPIKVLGYPIETVLAEKITTAIDLAETNTRVRDLADIYTLTGAHKVTWASMREALTTTATFRNVDLVPLMTAVGGLASLRRGDYRAYRDSLGHYGEHLPENLADAIAAAAGFADPLIHEAGAALRTWDPHARRWTASG
ncbi:MAG TPA: nucleotidyl transferase AbiEii/AbiGii toxin family protein [Thermoleophilaceae bacterium]|nr:nucleotidyl transferase AbiEii/AbiGii toxin family protein [Thermoleophilaceae bacterium]